MMVETLPPLPGTCKCRIRISELTERSVIVRSLVSDSMVMLKILFSDLVRAVRAS
jgi:hypothetical protein